MQKRLSKNLLFPILFFTFSSCAENPRIEPGQLATRSIEIRYIEADFNTAFKACTHSFFALGYTIKHSDKSSGILVGESKQSNTGQKVGLVLLFGIAGALIPTDVKQEITLFLEKGKNDSRTTMRIQMLKNGKAEIYPATVDKIWVIAQREAMLVKGITVPKELEEKYKALQQGGNHGDDDQDFSE